MASVDRALIKVGRSLRFGAWQMATKIYLPAIRLPIINGFRLGFGVAVIGVLLAETKLSNRASATSSCRAIVGSTCRRLMLC